VIRGSGNGVWGGVVGWREAWYADNPDSDIVMVVLSVFEIDIDTCHASI
jgi:hypothetical protein